MSSLKVNQIRSKLRSMFETYLDLSDLSATDAEREQKVLSRCLAALAIYLQAGCTEKEAAGAVWDGGDDNGIDAAYFDTSESRVLFAQAKWINQGSGEPEAKEIGAFVKGVRDAIEQDDTNFHPRLQARFADIALRLGTPGVRVHLVVICTGASHLARHGDAVLQGFLDELNGEDPDPIASSEIVGLSEVYDGLASDPSQTMVPLDATILEWSFVASPYQAYFGMIDGLQLKGWWKSYGRRIVSANIRHALGATEVNNEIRQTASSAPEKFWYFNNGITLVAEEASKAPAGASSRSAGVFSFKGASIVNGAQIVSSLAKVDDDSALGNVRLPVRVILLKSAPDGFGDDVTRTNNLQNRVEPRDFVAQDPEQKRLRQEMAIESVVYQFVRSEESVSSPTACELIEVTTALACAGGDSNLAVQVKTGIGRFFADLKKAPYRTLFNPSVSGAKAINATITHRAIEEWIEAKKKTVKRSGPNWGVLVHGNRILASVVLANYGVAKLSQPIKDYSTSFTDADISGFCEDAYAKMVGAVSQHYVGKFLAVLFKNPKMSKHIFDLARANSV
jgi:AIPR protein